MSDDTEVSKTPIGQTLKEAREKLGLSIADVSTSTKINSKILQALETGELTDLPAKSFTRGFIKVYANYLKVDPQPIIDAYEMEDPFLATLGKDLEKKEVSETPPSERISGIAADSLGKKPFIAAAIIVVILVVLGLKKVIDRYSKETVLPTTAQTESGTVLLDASESDQPEAKTAELESPDLTDEKSTSTGENNTNDENTLAVKATPTPIPTATTTPSPTPAPTAIPTPSPSPTPSPTPAPTATPSPSPTPAAKAPAKNPQQVIVEAMDNVTLDIRIDSEGSKEIKMLPGSIYTINADQSVSLKVSDGGLVNISVNGKDRGIAGDLGKSAQLKFP